MTLSFSQAEALLLEKTAECKKNGQTCLIAIEGNSGAGKSTFAARIADKAGASLYHTDDFFLPPELRTPERLAIPGGNIDSERLLTELIAGIMSGRNFAYRVFSCKDASYSRCEAVWNPINILEGVYSAHPLWQAQIDYKLFLTVSPELQQERILHRNGAAKLRDFTEKWIPLENKYFSFFQIREQCDLIVDGGSAAAI